MWRAIGVIAMCFLLCTACSRMTTAEPVGEGFTCTFDADYQDMNVCGTLTRKAAGTLTLEFDEPGTLSGLVATWDGEKVLFSLHGLEFSVSPDAVPESALGQELIAALDAVQRGEGERSGADGEAVLKGSGNHGEYVLRYDAETGMPRSLSVPALPLYITFSDVK